MTVFQTVFFLVHSNCQDSFNFTKTQILFQQLQADKLIWKSLTCLDISFFSSKCIYVIKHHIYNLWEGFGPVDCWMLAIATFKGKWKHLFLHEEQSLLVRRDRQFTWIDWPGLWPKTNENNWDFCIEHSANVNWIVRYFLANESTYCQPTNPSGSKESVWINKSKIWKATKI